MSASSQARSPGRSRAMILVAALVAATTQPFLDPGNLSNLVAAGLDRRDRGDRLDDRHPDRRHRSVARLGDRADDHGLRHRWSRFWACRSWSAILLVLAARPGARPRQRRAHRLSAHSLLHHDARGALGLPRRRLHVQQRLADLPGLARARADLLRRRCRHPAAALLRRRALRRWPTGSCATPRSAARSMRSAATRMRRGCPASMSRAPSSSPSSSPG